MPDTSGLPPPIDPAQTPAWLEAQRKQMLASMLMGSLQQSQQTPANWDSMKVVPHRGLMQNLAPLVTALMAGKAQKSALDATAAYYNPQPQQPQTPAQPDSGQTFSGPTGPIDAPGQQQPPQSRGLLPQAPQNPLIPPGMTLQQAQMLNLQGGREELVKAAIARAAPLEIQRQLRAANIDPNSPQGRAMILQTVQKGAYIPPIEQREGSVERDAHTNAVIGVNPKSPVGGVNFYDAQGNLTGSGMSPGAKEAIATSEGAATAGKVANTYNVVPTKGGGSAVLGGPHTGLTQPVPQAGTGAPVSKNAPSGPPGATAPAASGPWANVPKLQVPGGTGAPDTFVQNVLKGAAEKHQELVTKLGSEADLADQKMNYNREALKALPTAEVGPVSHFLTENRAKLMEWGLPSSMIPGSGSVTPTFELNKNLLNSALQGAKQTYGARMTGNEVMLQKNEASPSVATSQAAIRSLISQDNARNAYFKQRAQDYGQYQSAGGDPNRFESWYASKFPLQSFAQKYATPPKAIDQLKAHPEQAPFFKQKFGWLPDGIASH
jgi:hypothetical protein